MRMPSDAASTDATSTVDDRCALKYPWPESSLIHPVLLPIDRSPAPPLCTEQELRLDLGSADRVLRKTRLIALGTHRGTLNQADFSDGGGPRGCFHFAFHRSGVKLRVGNRQPEVLTSNNVSFHGMSEARSREAIGREGHDCDWIAIAPTLVQDLCTARHVEHWCADGGAFPRPSSPIKAAVFFAERKLFASVSDAARQPSTMQLEETVLGLLGRIVDDAMEFWGYRSKAQRRARPVCQRRRLQIVEEAKSILACEYRNDLSLVDLARRLHCSAAHLSRMFHAATGFNMNDYRQELRLRRGVFLLEESNLDVGDIAVDVGFSSHSHFTSAFFRRFGTNPSEFRKWKFSLRCAMAA